MRKLLAAVVTLAALAAPASALAHPLGNFTTNRYSRIELSGNRAYVLYVLDLAEIPTFQARPDVDRLGSGGYARRLAAEIRRHVSLTVGGHPRSLRELRRAIAFPKGVAGLRTTRLEIVFSAGEVAGGRARLEYADRNFADRIGWKEIVVRGDRGARVVRASVPARSISEELRAYPKNLLQSPLSTTTAHASFTPGIGAGVPPSVLDAKDLRSPVRVASATDTGFASLISRGDLGVGVILLSLLAAVFWGAAHALTPGHGKTIVAAYLVGSRGRPQHAFLLGLIVTVTHTIGVFALGLVTLALSEFIVPEQLYPWLNLVSALLVVGVGAAVLHARFRGWHRHHDHGHHHDHPHGQGHDHRHGHGHGHSHVAEPQSGLRGLVAVGVSGGLLPCPTALVVLLAAITLHRIGYGLALIVAFSFGLAASITGIGLVAVYAKRTFSRMSFQGRVVGALPMVSALVILALGLAMMVRALPKVT